MKAKELRDLSLDDLKQKLHELKENQFTLRFQSVTSPLNNPLLLRKNRREIARIKTIIREQHLKTRKSEDGKE